LLGGRSDWPARMDGCFSRLSCGDIIFCGCRPTARPEATRASPASIDNSGLGKDGRGILHIGATHSHSAIASATVRPEACWQRIQIALLSLLSRWRENLDRSLGGRSLTAHVLDVPRSQRGTVQTWRCASSDLHISQYLLQIRLDSGQLSGCFRVWMLLRMRCDIRCSFQNITRIIAARDAPRARAGRATRMRRLDPIRLRMQLDLS
jgi:hypothetical protein